jgi:hypothetical protein
VDYTESTEFPWIDPIRICLGCFAFFSSVSLHHYLPLTFIVIWFPAQILVKIIIIDNDKHCGLAYTGEREKGIQKK